MMQILFDKYHGTGNDFIIIDNRDLYFPHKGEGGKQIISHLCHRHMGIGADGLILIEQDSQVDFRMRFFNANGLPGSFCGNGSRCAIAFVYQNNIIPKENLSFAAADGLHHALVSEVQENFMHIRITLRDVPVPRKTTTAEPFHRHAYFVNTGSPHVVIFADKADSIEVPAEGWRIRNDVKWQPEGTNVNFVEQLRNGKIYVRTFERGVENETLSCGSGVTAAAIAASHKGINNMDSASVLTRGGELQVSFLPPAKGRTNYTSVALEGPAVRVYSGRMTQTTVSK